MKKGKVYLIGAGPGRPDLLTVRGREILAAADTVIYDYLLDPGFLLFTRKGAECIPCSDTGKKHPDPKRRKKAQEKINRIMIRESKKGKKVARLKNGDVSIFSRLADELKAFSKHRVEFELVPGVTAASAAAAFGGIPLTDRELASSVVMVTGHEDIDKKKSAIDWKGIASSGTIVLYMAVCVIDRVVKLLLKAGKSADTPSAAVSNAGSIAQRVARTSLKELPREVKRQGIKAPAIFIIGKVVNRKADFDWYTRNRKILFTGLSEERFFLKGTYVHVPMIKIKELENYGEFDRRLKKLSAYDWIVFTSRYGVKYFFKRLQALGFDSRKIGNVKVAAIGRSTSSSLVEYGIMADLVPRVESSRGLVKLFGKIDLAGKKVFMPHSDISDKGLEEKFAKMGAHVTAPVAYRNVMPDDLPELDLERFDEIMFTSPSTVRNFKKRYGKVPENIKVRCIGDVTLREAKKCLLKI
ncbi:MAG: uroporphyrinogen-III C-methyltransferase [Candidatus Omnitrophota bacterium]|jgi:uroporphyrinogen III methyltransferase/synthase